jgi:orotidine-5'-phosphate decarboxylase
VADPAATIRYGERLSRVVAERGPLCVGIDPHPSMLRAWGLGADVAGLEACARGMVEALGAEVAVFKPQSAFYEAHGSAGVAVLERVLADIAATGALSLLDVKRGDIGSTMDAYAQAYLSDGSPLAADAVTLSPYLGRRARGGERTRGLRPRPDQQPRGPQRAARPDQRRPAARPAHRR